MANTKSEINPSCSKAGQTHGLTYRNLQLKEKSVACPADDKVSKDEMLENILKKIPVSVEETSQVIKYLEFSDLIEIHGRHLSSEGIEVSFAGVLHNPNSLGYLLDVVRIEQSQSDPYPTLAEKAAVYAFNIITRHVFVDGNKRTGMTAMFWFLNLNGADLKDITSKEIVNVALSIA